MSTWIQTRTGLRFDYANPCPDMIELEDIAHALAHTCRYGGHCDPFYSVAEHSVHVLERVLELEPGNADLARAALLHDAAEAYIGDFPSPLKRYLGANVRKLEAEIMAAVAERFAVPIELFSHPSLHRADLEVLMAEAPQLLTPAPGREWGPDVAAWAGFSRWVAGPHSMVSAAFLAVARGQGLVLTAAERAAIAEAFA